MQQRKRMPPNKKNTLDNERAIGHVAEVQQRRIAIHLVTQNMFHYNAHCYWKMAVDIEVWLKNDNKEKSLKNQLSNVVFTMWKE